MKQWGEVFFLAAFALICRTYLRRPSFVAFLEAAALAFLSFFCLMTEMHERYLMYAVIFLGTLVPRRQYVVAGCLLTVTLVLNLEYGMTYMYLEHVSRGFST
ncbi:MAG: hypothetical protein ABR591_04015 [Candidatus Velthaea sp.]